jgi:hypothetical protein
LQLPTDFFLKPSFEKFEYYLSLPKTPRRPGTLDTQSAVESLFYRTLKPDLLKDSIQMARWLEEHGEVKETLEYRTYMVGSDPRIESILEAHRN